MKKMVEYTEKDAKKIGDALRTLILRSAEANGNSLDCTITFGDLALDCHFEFSQHKEA